MNRFFRGMRNGVSASVYVFVSLYFCVLLLSFYIGLQSGLLQDLLPGNQSWVYGAASAALCALGVFAFYRIMKFLIHARPIRLPDWALGVLIASVCFGAHLIMLRNIQVEQISDFAMYYDLALAYARDGVFNATDYIMVVAPNILIYIAALGEFIRLLGESTLAGEWMNLMFMAGSSVALYALSRRILNKNAALLVALIFALSPNNLLFTLCLATEPMAIFLLLLALLFAFRALDQKKSGSAAAYGLASGLLFSLSNTVRAVAIAFFIAFILFLLLWPRAEGRSFVSGRLPILIGLTLGYIAFSRLFSAIEWEVYQTQLGINYGWSLFEGLDNISYGGWRAENSEALYQAIKEYPVNQAQAHLLELAIARVSHYSAADWLDLFIGKGHNIWIYNDYAYSAIITNNAAIAQSAWDLSALLAPIANLINALHRLLLMSFSFCLMRAIFLRKRKGPMGASKVDSPRLGHNTACSQSASSTTDCGAGQKIELTSPATAFEKLFVFAMPVAFLILFHSFATSIPRYHFPAIPMMLICVCYIMQSAPTAREKRNLRNER